MKKALLFAAMALGVMAIPASPAFAISDCEYAGGGPVAVYTSDGRTDDSVAGACVDTNVAPVDGGYVEIGSGTPGTYAVIDGSDDNNVTGQDDGYAGISTYETGSFRDASCSPSGPDQGETSSSNSGGCIGFDPSVPVVGGTYVGGVPIACGNTSGNDWAGDGSSGSHTRDGCSIP